MIFFLKKKLMELCRITLGMEMRKKKEKKKEKNKNKNVYKKRVGDHFP